MIQNFNYINSNQFEVIDCNDWLKQTSLLIPFDGFYNKDGGFREQESIISKKFFFLLSYLYK